MARITVEDCLSKVKSHFDLVILAAKRARQISNGAPVDYSEEGISKEDKSPIIALREIAHDLADVEQLEEAVVNGYRRMSEVEEAEDFEEDIEFDSFDDPEMLKATEAEEVKEDELSIIDEVQAELDKE